MRLSSSSRPLEAWMSARPARSTSTALRADPSSVTRIVWSVSTHSPDTSASDNRIASATIREKMDRRTAMSAPVEQAVARPPDGFERRGRKTLLQLAAQPYDIDVDDIGLRVERHVPHVAQQQDRKSTRLNSSH